MNRILAALAVYALIGHPAPAQDDVGSLSLGKEVSGLGAYDGGAMTGKVDLKLPGPGAGMVVLDDERCFVVAADHPDRNRPGWLGCYDQKTGKPVWEKKSGEFLTYGSSVLKVHEGYLISSGNNGSFKDIWGGWIACHEAKTGKELWRHPLRDLPGSVGSVLVSGDRVVVAGTSRPQSPLAGSGPAPGAHPAAIAGRRFFASGRYRVDGKEAYWLAGYDGSTGRELWKRREGESPAGLGPLRAAGDALYAMECPRGSSGRRLARYDAETGNLLWERRLPHEGRWDIAGKRLVLATGDPWIGCYDTDTGKPLWELGQDRLPPIPADPSLYMRIDGKEVLVCKVASSGDSGWIARFRLDSVE